MADRVATVGDEVQIVGPLRPLRTGIAGYLEDQLDAVDGSWNVRMVPEPGSRQPSCATVNPVSAKSLTARLPLVSHLGNSELHPLAYDTVRNLGGIAVLHDAVLTHSRFVEAVQSRKMSDFRREAERLYGGSGLRVVDDLWRGRPIAGLERYPFVETVLARASAAIVHNTFAKSVVRSACPHLEVAVVPMGVPLPRIYDRDIARRLLGIPTSAFVIASITHLNPFKRLDVVLRALRRLIPRMPETQLIVAGSPTPEVPIERMAWTLGIDRNVRALGYVSDEQARLLACAADVCVNLRHPSLGETSASLLRLLGAGRPVIVTEGPVSADLPDDVAIPVPPGSHEVEILQEILALLADDDEVRESTGAASRRFVEEQHSMRDEVAGYARLLERVYGVQLPVPDPPNSHETGFDITASGLARPGDAASVDEWWPARRSADSAADLRLDADDGFLRRLAARHIELGLDKVVGAGQPDFEGEVSQSIVDLVACPNCGHKLEARVQVMHCRRCDSRFRAGGECADLRGQA